MNILTASDDIFAIPLGVMLTSLFENTSSCKMITVYIIDNGISQVKKGQLLRIAEKNGVNLHFLEINQNEFKDFVTLGHITITTYYRLKVPDLLDHSIDKVLYLDCDLIIKEDISTLWATDISQHHLAAVIDVGIDSGDCFSDTKSRLEIPYGYHYFNSGVMLINLTLWRRDNIHKRVIEFISSNSDKIILCDQDGLNAILFDKWLSLPLTWNQQPRVYTLIKTVKDPGYHEAINNPSIIHFCGSSKPWQRLDAHPLKKEYYKYLALTEWKSCEVSVIIPANKKENPISTILPEIQNFFQENALIGEIIVTDVSDGQTAEIARSFGATILSQRKKGIGNAYRAAMEQVPGQCYILWDPEGPWDFRVLPALLDPLKNGADLVVGSRFTGIPAPGSMDPPPSTIGNSVITWMINCLFRTHYSDATSGFRGIPHEALDRLDLKTGNSEFGIEMLLLASKEQLKIVEVPIHYSPGKNPFSLQNLNASTRRILFILFMKIKFTISHR